MDIDNENNLSVPNTINNVALGLAFFSGHTSVIIEDQYIVLVCDMFGTVSWVLRCQNEFVGIYITGQSYICWHCIDECVRWYSSIAAYIV